MDQKKVLEHIYNVIKPRDTDQFIRYCYLNLHGDISDKEFDDYISHVRREVFENWYTEDDLEKIIKDWKFLMYEWNPIREREKNDLNKERSDEDIRKYCEAHPWQNYEQIKAEIERAKNL